MKNGVWGCRRLLFGVVLMSLLKKGLWVGVGSWDIEGMIADGAIWGWGDIKW